MKKRRLLAIFAATVIMAGTAFAAGCNKSSSGEPDSTETFEGAVSEQSYDTQDAAVEACLENEINGSDYGVEFSSYEKSADLTQAEITELKVEDKVDGTVESVEKGKIYFTDSSSATAQAAAASSNTGLYINVYIIKYTPTGKQVSKYTYLIPLPENGEPLSYSYYSDVMAADKYTNCTMDCTISSTSSASGMTMTLSNVYTMKFAGDTAYIYAKLSEPNDYGQTENRTVNMYITESTSGLKCAAQVDGSDYITANLSSLLGIPAYTISDLVTSQITEAQCSMYVKTNYGFELNTKFLEEVLAESLGGSGMAATFSDMSYKFYVTNGRMSKATSNVKMSMSYMGQTVTATAKAEVSYKAFGSTTVEIPANVKTLLGITE